MSAPVYTLVGVLPGANTVPAHLVESAYTKTLRIRPTSEMDAIRQAHRILVEWSGTWQRIDVLCDGVALGHVSFRDGSNYGKAAQWVPADEEVAS